LEKILVGWNEYVDLPDWGIKRLGAKIDTRARSSALHVEDLVTLPRGRICFRVVVHREHRDRHVLVVARISRRARVRSSNGEFETRYFISTPMKLGAIEKESEMSLVDRGKMVNRMLIGRTALAGDFIVDVSRRHLLDRPRRRKRPKSTRQTRRRPASH